MAAAAPRDWLICAEAPGDISGIERILALPELLATHKRGKARQLAGYVREILDKARSWVGGGETAWVQL